jgi:hypothetical protein
VGPHGLARGVGNRQWGAGLVDPTISTAGSRWAPHFHPTPSSTPFPLHVTTRASLDETSALRYMLVWFTTDPILQGHTAVVPTIRNIKHGERPPVRWTVRVQPTLPNSASPTAHHLALETLDRSVLPFSHRPLSQT